MVLNKIFEMETTQCDVIVCDTGETILGERLYTIESYHRKNKNSNIRFGTLQQLYNIMVTYQYGVKPEYKKAYEEFVSDLSIRKLS